MNIVCVGYILVSWSLVFATLELCIYEVVFRIHLEKRNLYGKNRPEKNQNNNLTQVIISFIIVIDLYTPYILHISCFSEF